MTRRSQLRDPVQSVHDPRHPGALYAQTVADSAAPRVTSAGRAFWPAFDTWLHIPDPAPDRLITGTVKHKSLVMKLQKQFSNQLGFLPGKAIDFYLEAGHVGIALENGEPCGYVLGRPSFRYQRLLRPITQAAVFLDAQRRHHGLALVEAICRRARDAGQLAVQCSCRQDIEAVDFWNAAGFIPIEFRTIDNARRQPIIVLRRCLTDRPPDWFHTPPPLAGHRSRKTVHHPDAD